MNSLVQPFAVVRPAPVTAAHRVAEPRPLGVPRSVIERDVLPRPVAAQTYVLVDPITSQPALFPMLTALGLRPLRVAKTPIPTAPGALIISVERFFHDTLTQQAWLSAGHRVLPIYFDEHTVTIGPEVSADTGACGSCCNASLAARNPRWRDLALQRMGLRAPLKALRCLRLWQGLS